MRLYQHPTSNARWDPVHSTLRRPWPLRRASVCASLNSCRILRQYREILITVEIFSSNIRIIFVLCICEHVAEGVRPPTHALGPPGGRTLLSASLLYSVRCSFCARIHSGEATACWGHCRHLGGSTIRITQLAARGGCDCYPRQMLPRQACRPCSKGQQQ